jgi:hypothetical protein
MYVDVWKLADRGLRLIDQRIDMIVTCLKTFCQEENLGQLLRKTRNQVTMVAYQNGILTALECEAELARDGHGYKKVSQPFLIFLLHPSTSSF